MSFTDADLIARALIHEDQNAFGELVRRYQSPVRGFLIKMTNGDVHLADDLAQETFVKVWNKLGSFRGEGKFSTWLFGIAHNEWRMSQRGRRELALDELEALPSVATTESDKTAATHWRMDVAEALKTLTSAERAAIVLCCQNSFSHEEAARALDCPLGTLKTNILRGKEKLRKRLAV